MVFVLVFILVFISITRTGNLGPRPRPALIVRAHDLSGRWRSRGAGFRRTAAVLVSIKKSNFLRIVSASGETSTHNLTRLGPPLDPPVPSRAILTSLSESFGNPCLAFLRNKALTIIAGCILAKHEGTTRTYLAQTGVGSATEYTNSERHLVMTQRFQDCGNPWPPRPVRCCEGLK